MPLVRRARPEDALGIHETHMRSIREVCSKDHSPDEIRAWGHRPYRETQRLDAIKNQFVWVAEDNGIIVGYGHLGFQESTEGKSGYIYGLYLASGVIRQGLGRQILALMIAECREQGVEGVALHSTLTALHFYRQLGFLDTGIQTAIEIGGVPIRCIPMELRLA